MRSSNLVGIILLLITFIVSNISHSNKVHSLNERINELQEELLIRDEYEAKLESEIEELNLYKRIKDELSKGTHLKTNPGD